VLWIGASVAVDQEPARTEPVSVGSIPSLHDWSCGDAERQFEQDRWLEDAFRVEEMDSLAFETEVNTDYGRVSP
jgi:hypothetical protein